MAGVSGIIRLTRSIINQIRAIKKGEGVIRVRFVEG